MSVMLKTTGSALVLVAALAAVNVAQAQTRPASSSSKPSAAAKPAAGNQKTASPDTMFARWDTDKNNALSLSEFKTGWQEVQANLILRQLHENFMAMDANKSGAIEAAEYANLELIKKAGASAPPMSSFDQDKNQRLDFNEYINMVKAMVKPKS